MTSESMSNGDRKMWEVFEGGGGGGGGWGWVDIRCGYPVRMSKGNIDRRSGWLFLGSCDLFDRQISSGRSWDGSVISRSGAHADALRAEAFHWMSSIRLIRRRVNHPPMIHFQWDAPGCSGMLRDAPHFLLLICLN